MANTPFIVPELQAKGAFKDARAMYPGGFGWRHNIDMKQVLYPVFHHSVTNPSGNAKKDVDYIWKIHRDKNGWAGIGYNLIITSQVVNGYAVVYYVGDLANARAHTPNQKGVKGIKQGYGNNHIIGICFIGTFHTGKLPSKAQLRSAHLLTKELIYKENIRLPKIADTWASNSGHKVFDWTACPSNQLPKLLSDVIKAVPLKPPTPPKPIAPEYLRNYKPLTARKVRLYGDTNLVDFRDGRIIKKLLKGTTLDVAGKTTKNKMEYFITKYRVGKLKKDKLSNGNLSATSEGWAGFSVVPTIPPVEVTPKPVPPIPNPDPAPAPKPPVDDGTTPYPADGETDKLKNWIDKIKGDRNFLMGLLARLVEAIVNVIKRSIERG